MPCGSYLAYYSVRLCLCVCVLVSVSVSVRRVLSTDVPRCHYATLRRGDLRIVLCA